MKINLNSDKIFKHFKFDIEINYIRMLIFWNELIFMFFFMIAQYCWIFINLCFVLMKQIRKKNFKIILYDRKMIKYFMKNIVRDCCIEKKKTVDVHHVLKMNRFRRWLKTSIEKQQNFFQNIWIYLLYSYFHLFLFFFHLRNLMIFLIHINRTAKEISTFNYWTNLTFYNDKSFRYYHQIHVNEKLTLI